MSPESAEVVRSWLGTFGDDPEAFRELLHPELEWFPFEENHTPSYGVDGGMRIRNQWTATWDDMQVELEDLVEAGEDVVASIRVAARGKASGVEVDVRLHIHFKVRDGKIAYVFEHEDKGAALEAIGLRE